MSPWVWLRRRGDALAVVRARRGSRCGRSRCSARCRSGSAASAVSRSEARSSRRLPSTSPSVKPDVLDPDRRVVEADRVAAHEPQRDELVDRAVAVDDEVRAESGSSCSSGSGASGAKVFRVGGRARRDGDVLDDHLRVAQAVRVDP